MSIDPSIIDRVCLSRPKNNREISQYFMKPEGMLRTLEEIKSTVNNKKIFFIGDGDHMSPLLSYFFNVKSIVIDIDHRIIENQHRLATELGIERNHRISYDDVRNDFSKYRSENVDGFFINPPFSKVNKGYGVKVWLSKTIQFLEPGCFGILIMPTTREHLWCTENWFIVQKFLTKNNFSIYRISEDFHEYYDVEPYRTVRSSIIYLHYLGRAKFPINKITKSLYF